jgi:hypothetical protein
MMSLPYQNSGRTPVDVHVTAEVPRPRRGARQKYPMVAYEKLVSANGANRSPRR